jgi:GNAT superfamily N-acetyltransferase
MATAAVRPAALPDVDEIVRIQAATWETAYSRLLPATALDRLRSEQAHHAWAAAIDTGHVLVATEGEWTAGFCAATRAAAPAGSTPATDAVLGAEAWGEIGVLLVEPRWGRRGHGGRLLAAAAEELRGDGAVYGLAWVPESDSASRGFYTRVGWEPDGTVRVLDTGDGELREIRMVGSLDLRLQE